MKKLLVFTAAVILTATAFSQVSLSYQNNGLISGDSTYSREIQYVSPGDQGPDQIWDFSKIQYTGKDIAGDISSIPPKDLPGGGGEYNSITNEDGYTYYNKISQNVVELKGYDAQVISAVYSNSIIKIKYPFSYGDHYTDPFAGNAVLCGEYAVSFSGDYSVTADAYGTLALPEFSINNTLRIKTEKNTVEIRPCGIVESRSTQFQWFAPGFRYPVLTMTTKESTYNGVRPSTITQIAFLNLNQVYNNSTASIKEKRNSFDKADFTVNSYPNPFNEKITFSYFLRKQMNVSVSLCDMSGKWITDIENTQTRAEGLYTGSFDAAGKSLPPGVYYLRFTFNKKTITHKVVKN